ncbi:MAG: hypothetical protein OXT65_04290 [Alphaproteobacteria bacterium]|nr:hypothetical protein [Alphaproteobacteria bacterium]
MSSQNDNEPLPLMSDKELLGIRKALLKEFNKVRRGAESAQYVYKESALVFSAMGDLAQGLMDVEREIRERREDREPRRTKLPKQVAKL